MTFQRLSLTKRPTLMKKVEQVGFLDAEFYYFEECCANEAVLNTRDHVYKPIEMDELASSKLNDWFPTDVLRCLNKGGVIFRS